MTKTSSTTDFKIHVDSSCLTDSTDLQMAPAERVVSDQTVVHHDSWSEVSEAKAQDGEAAAEVAVENGEENKDTGHGENNEAQQDGENHEDESSEDENVLNAREQQIDRIEAQIQAAARAVVASIEKEHYVGQEDSVVSMQTDESYDQEGSQITYDEGTELTYGDGTELTYDGTETSYEPRSEDEEGDAAGDSSSHHDGDIDDDDVFSRNSGHSARSSLNSVHDPSSADEVQSKELTSPTVGEEAIRSSPAPEESDTISRVPSSASYTPRDATPMTPSKVLSRPPFRTPSSVRAMQMSSPTPSLFSSPRSSKRHLPTVSRIGTPTTFSSPSKNRTPTRFKAKKEHPLVLLHVTILPLTWSYSHIISSPELPVSLQRVKENWRLLQEKLGDTVLERGILLPHPQDSYEILEERLLEALELPIRPRARILKCGHYMGPETPSSDEEEDAYFEGGTKVEGNRRWCDICRRDVRLEGVDMAGREGEKRFRIKIYASNGLMRAGAWVACWREMERIDVEIEPFVEGNLVAELEEFAAVAVIPKDEEEARQEEEGDGFVDDDAHKHDHAQESENSAEQEEQMRVHQEEEMARLLIEEEELHRRAEEEQHMHRKLQDEERMREIYGEAASNREESRARPSRRASPRPTLDDDSLLDLLLKAFQVAMRDKKNVVICVLSVIVLLLALRPGNSVPEPSQVIMTDSAPVQDVVMDMESELIKGATEVVTTTRKVAEEVTQDIRRDVPVMKADTHVVNKPVVESQKPATQETPIINLEIKETLSAESNVQAPTEEQALPSSQPASAPEPIEEPTELTEGLEQTAVEE